MESDTHEESLAPAATPSSAPRAPKQKLTAREARRRRRRARRRSEEILAWFLVPVIVLGVWFGANAVFDFFGTTPGTVWDQLMQVKKQFEKKM